MSVRAVLRPLLPFTYRTALRDARSFSNRPSQPTQKGYLIRAFHAAQPDLGSRFAACLAFDYDECMKANDADDGSSQCLQATTAACCAVALRLALNGVLLSAVAWAAFSLQHQDFVPFVLFPLIYPLLVGAVLGAGQVGILRLTGVMSRRWALTAAVLMGLLAATGQDYIGYLTQRRALDAYQSKHPQWALAVQRIGPGGFGDFLANGWQAQPLLRTLDALLTAAGSLIVVAALVGSTQRAEHEPSSNDPAKQT